jgi:hypothetical protein
MSARPSARGGQGVGASARPNIFNAERDTGELTSARDISSNEKLPDPVEIDHELHQQYGISNYGDSSPLQLEHIIGDSGSFRKTMLMAPDNENKFYRSLGNLVSIENLQDPHDQVLLRGHDMPVSLLFTVNFTTIHYSFDV